MSKEYLECYICKEDASDRKVEVVLMNNRSVIVCAHHVGVKEEACASLQKSQSL